MDHQSDFVPIADVRSARQRRGITVIEVIVCIGIIGLLVALLLPAMRSARTPARRNMCVNNLKQIALALHNYNDVYKTFPPAYTVDAEGRPLHSWRTLILPYIEETALYKKIDLSKPWDDPANAEAFKTPISAYQCPSSEAQGNQTTYLAIVAPDGFFQNTEPRNLSDVTDGASKTIMVIDVPSDQSVPWMAPQDADEKLLMAIGPDLKLSHRGIFLAAFVDGHVRSFESELPADKRRALITIAADDPVDLED
jgi:type II secretory pathway pseudopilin PulG